MVNAILDMRQTAKLPQKQYGLPQVILDPVVFDDSPISQIVDDGKYMYILVDDHQGYVQVYTLNGEYLKTLSFWYESNGAFSMAAENDIVYIRDIKRNIYVFHAGSFDEFISQHNVSDRVRNMKFGQSSERFKIRGGSVWRVDIQEPIKVIPRTINAILNQYNIPDILFLGTLPGLYLLGCRSRRANKDRGRFSVLSKNGLAVSSQADEIDHN